MTHEGIAISLLNEKFLQPPYLIFQEILNHDETDLSSVHMVKVNTSGPLSLGRALKNDIRINDITLSRNHAHLKATKFGVFLQDSKSKFGSLVMLRKPFEITRISNGQVFQVGRAFMNAEVDANWKFYVEPEYVKKPRTFLLKDYQEKFNWVNFCFIKMH